MDLTTRYLGLQLAHPLVPGASPLTANLDDIRRLEDAGASAFVLRSLFEEELGDDNAGVARYLELLRSVKEVVAVPVIASLNGVSPRGWVDAARLMPAAGADAVELNFYRVATDPQVSGSQIERDTIDIVREVRQAVAIPVAVKLSAYFTSMANFARELARAGASGLVLFNRFYEPDIDASEQAITHTLFLSTSNDLLIRLHWMAILSGRVEASLAVTGGVHTGLDVVKATMAGAHVTQVVSALLRHGPDRLRVMINGLKGWMRDHEWYSLDEMRGTMNLSNVEDPAAYERGNYLAMLQSWKV